MIFKETVKPRISDCDRSGRLSCEAILHILEDVGCHHSDAVNDNVIQGSRNGTAWVLVDWRVEITRHPANGDVLYISTWARGRASAGAMFRDFIVSGADGGEFLRAEAKFALLDLSIGSLVRISDELFAAYAPEDTPVFSAKSARLRAPTRYDTEQVLTLRRSDFDFNGHVHNTRYMELAQETLPAALCAKTTFRAFRIIYTHPLQEGDTAVVRHQADGGVHRIGIYSTHTLCCLVELTE